MRVAQAMRRMLTRSHAALSAGYAPSSSGRLHRPELTPAQSLLLGFTLLTLAGALMLSLPISAAGDASIPFLDAFFTASSAVTTTGLVVVDTGSAYSFLGQLVILALFQLGGLGYMLFVVYIAFLLGAGPSLKAGLVVKESVAGVRLGGLKEFVRSILLFTLVFEGLGAAILTAFWAGQFPLLRAAYIGIFHSVSAFCTAGFSLFADSFTAARDRPFVHLTIALVTFAGGIGFFVLADLWGYARGRLRRKARQRLSVHTRLALVISAILIFGGSLILFVAERITTPTPIRMAVFDASFQAISASTTTGFNTVDIGKMTATGLFAMIVLMFIGIGSGGTGGGIKVTTLGVAVASVATLVRGSQDTVVFGRRMPLDTVYRALTIGLLATLLVVMVTLVLTLTERSPFLPILFEVVSAFGTVGLSAGITPALSPAGKILISMTMLIGRLGPLGVGFALVGKPRRTLFRYVEGEVFVG